MLVPGLLAFVFGYLRVPLAHQGRLLLDHHAGAHLRRMLLFFRNDTGFGGNNGFTDFKRILGFPITAPATRMALFAITGAALLGVPAARPRDRDARSSAAC